MSWPKHVQKVPRINLAYEQCLGREHSITLESRALLNNLAVNKT